MARKLRLEFGGACYHVINRGNYRRHLFGGKGAADSFQACLFEAAQRFGWRLHAFVIMSNHFHLALETPEPNLSEGMKWLQGTWANRFNRFQGEVGRPFQGRYKALHVEPGHTLAQVAHYIHLNPVRANLVSCEKLNEYRWSSLEHFPKKDRPACLYPETILRESGGLSDTAAGWKRYVQYLGLLAEEDVQRRKERFGRLSRGWMIGSAEFKTALKRDLATVAVAASQFQVLGADRHAHREVREQVWEEKLGALAHAFGTRLDKLPTQRSAEEKVRLAAAMKITCSVSNTWLAHRLDMGEPASVSQYVRRYRLAGEMNKRQFKQVLSRVTT